MLVFYFFIPSFLHPFIPSLFNTLSNNINQSTNQQINKLSLVAPSPILLSTAYLPPVQYMTKFLLNEPVLVELHENYQKQSYRNRCYIFGANGKQCLVIPVKKTHGEKMPLASVEIDYCMNWQKSHVKAIESAYRLSAFYEYYADDFTALFNQQIPLLTDWNAALLNWLLSALNITRKPAVTNGFEPALNRQNDFRSSIHPKTRLSKPDAYFQPLPYQQVFQDRYGFLPNLSIIDLLFNEGPRASEVLMQSFIQPVSPV
ncbi:MAG: WbqC family protein [Bacteroidales bacterium]|nr:WbqC family protein [Bacteroidales bacterium]